MNEPLLSILLPSRSREGVSRVMRLADSFRDMAHNPNRFEIIVRFDFDDAVSLSTISRLEDYGNIRVIVGRRFDGYHNLHIFANECAALSEGRWLGFFNDDAWVQSAGWDEKLVEFESTHPADQLQVCFTAVDMPKGSDQKQLREFKLGPRYDFPIISRRLYEAAGVWCPMPVLDWFWHETVFQKFRQLGGSILSDWVMCHNYERGDRVACCNDELCAQRYKTQEFQDAKQQCFDRIAKTL